RGTVPREAQTLGSMIGSHDNPDKAEADRINREIFDETMDVILAAFGNETFSYRGRHFTYPPAGIPDRGGTVQNLTLVPRPLYPFDTWQAITSPPTLEYVPKRGWGGVFWLKHHRFTVQWWRRFAELYEEAHQEPLDAGRKRMLVLNVRVEDTHEKAWETARAGHDEFWKFLGPYGWSRGYMGEDGRLAPPGLIPTLEQSVAQKTWVIGTAEEVAEGVAFYADALGGLEHLTFFPHLPGETYGQAAEQIHRLGEEVLPLL
ncbi:MAG: LLM class flavin-dependent oxidoreductase, partial [Acidimicrobiia bacterium]|nr:LLM class flavin-dependent oxidoreductase [Acidimicrobiia bacterium]